ncbi:MAG: sulfatase-like hydrolase/transferase [Spirochaetaceae bacterium]|nr:sulfatase-like hydrolase/transferase [Spirochaetaceae bacterium]
MPNLVLIMSDEARKDVLFHEHYPFARTPNIDALRAEAVSFGNCFANYPVCVPSRASLITGRYPHQVGVLHNTHRLPAGERDLGHHLSAHGFDCVAFGKTHGVNRGFRSVTYDKVATMGFENHGYLEDPERITGVFDRPAEEYCDFVACRQFDDYLRGRAAGAPFAAFVGIYAPHPPLYPPLEYAGLYSADRITLPPRPSVRHNAARPWIQGVPRRRWDSYPDATRRQVIATYLALITLLDDCVGRILATLRATATLDDTLVVLVSDHGDQLGEHGMAGKMGNLYEASVRVPLVIRLPGAAHAGADRQQLVEMVDLFPTICDLLGVPHPEGLQAPAGRSLVPVVAHADSVHRRIVHAMLLEGQMARTERLKLNFYADDRCELYDLADDPEEATNRYDDPAYRARQQELLAEITRFLIRYPRVADRRGNEYFG